MLFSRICAFLPIAILVVNAAPLANNDLAISRRQVSPANTDIDFDPAQESIAYGFIRPNPEKREAYYAPSIESKIKRSQAFGLHEVKREVEEEFGEDNSFSVSYNNVVSDKVKREDEEEFDEDNSFSVSYNNVVSDKVKREDGEEFDEDDSFSVSYNNVVSGK